MNLSDVKSNDGDKDDDHVVGLGVDEHDEGQGDAEVTATNEESKLLEDYTQLLKKCRKIATAIHHSSVLASLLRQKQIALDMPQHQIIHDMPTRWNTIFLMLQRILEQYEALNETFDDNINKRKFEALKLTEEDRANLFDVVSVLQSFYDATVELSASKYATLSIVLPVFIT